MRSAQSATGSGVGDGIPAWTAVGEEVSGAAASAARVLADGGRALVILSWGGQDTGVPLLGLGTAMLTTVDPWGAVGEWEEAALVI